MRTCIPHYKLVCSKECKSLLTQHLKQFIKIGLYRLTIYGEFGMINTCLQSR